MENNVLECSWEEYKAMAEEFLESAPTLEYIELDNAFNSLTTGYLNLSENEMRSESALLVLKMASKEFMLRECVLGMSE